MKLLFTSLFFILPLQAIGAAPSAKEEISMVDSWFERKCSNSLSKTEDLYRTYKYVSPNCELPLKELNQLVMKRSCRASTDQVYTPNAHKLSETGRFIIENRTVTEYAVAEDFIFDTWKCSISTKKYFTDGSRILTFLDKQQHFLAGLPTDKCFGLYYKTPRPIELNPKPQYGLQVRTIKYPFNCKEKTFEERYKWVMNNSLGSLSVNSCRYTSGVTPESTVASTELFDRLSTPGKHNNVMVYKLGSGHFDENGHFTAISGNHGYELNKDPEDCKDDHLFETSRNTEVEVKFKLEKNEAQNGSRYKLTPVN